VSAAPTTSARRTAESGQEAGAGLTAGAGQEASATVAAKGTTAGSGQEAGGGAGTGQDGGVRRPVRRCVAARVPALLRDAGFRRYWGGQTISMFGDQVSSVALPLVAVLTLRASPAQMGFLAALVWLPSPLFGLHAGALADRHGHWRAMMIVADLGRAALLASIPVCYALGVLTIWPLYAVALGTGAFSVLFTVRQPTLFVALVPSGSYLEGNSLIYGSRALSFTGGPSAGAVGGVLGALGTRRLSARLGGVRFYTASCLVFTRRWCWCRWPAAPSQSSSRYCSPPSSSPGSA
jgi:MFS family permease